MIAERTETPGDERSDIESPSIDVLLAAYNGARYLRPQIESILGQEGVSFRILVRDDGSADETPALTPRRPCGERQSQPSLHDRGRHSVDVGIRRGWSGCCGGAGAEGLPVEVVDIGRLQDGIVRAAYELD